MMSIPLTDLRWGILASTTASTWGIVAAISRNPDHRVRGLFRRYVAGLDARLHTLRRPRAGRRIAVGQLALLALAGALAASLRDARPLAFTPAIVGAAPMGLAFAFRTRKRELDAQVTGFVTAFTNALKATPSIMSAFSSLEEVVGPPMRDEIACTIHDVKLGATPEEAMLALGGRVRSFKLDAVLCSVLVGQRIGGNVTAMLLNTAKTLREMDRLEGVIKRHTANSRAQFWILAVLPFALVLLFDLFSPGYFDPLTNSSTGIGMLITAVGLWLAAMLLTRKVLAVRT